MPDSRRFRPYIWVTWLTKILSGENVCEWAPWYRAHYRFSKREIDGGDLDQWKIDHDQMVRARVDKLTRDGWNVTTENSNKFKLEGVNGDLAGQPDIVAMRTTGHDGAATKTTALVVDEKSGQKRVSDVWQVLMYLWALPRLFLRNVPIDGEVEYRGSVTEVRSSVLDAVAKAKIQTLLQVVSGDLEPPRTPSAQECHFCDIATCPDRIEAKEHVGSAKDVF